MNDRVLALAWDSAGSALYAGGEFTTDDGWSLMDPHLVIVAGGHTIWLPVVVKVADFGRLWY